MSVLNQYITFLSEYKKLLERGIKDILTPNVSKNYIWVEDIGRLIEAEMCNSFLPNLFKSKLEPSTELLSIKKPVKPNISIPDEFSQSIVFNEAKNKFESSIDAEHLSRFVDSEVGSIEARKINDFEFSKQIYSKLYRAFNDSENDSNVEIVLSVGLFQYSKINNNRNVSKTNQHLFHFPLKIEIKSTNTIKIKFSEAEKPYVDFFFLNSTLIEKNILNNIVDTFDSKVEELGFNYLFEVHFAELISNYLQQLSEFSLFVPIINKPESDFYKHDNFGITFSPAINVKTRKPRFFEKLTAEISKYSIENKPEAPLFNLLARNPVNIHSNSYSKANYFTDELYEKYKQSCSNLTSAEDFSVFFPLPSNKEQKQIYENFLKNRLTVVEGPPGTGKSHTIVNILCSFLAQGKRVLVTAQTDKALESLLSKIPENFDSLIFTKIQLENKKERFSLEKSIDNISHILTDNFTLNIQTKIDQLNRLKGYYKDLKSKIHEALAREYSIISLTDSFQDLRSYQIFEKLSSKNNDEWNWIADVIKLDIFTDFDVTLTAIFEYIDLFDCKNSELLNVNINLDPILSELTSISFDEYLLAKSEVDRLVAFLQLDGFLKEKILKINLETIISISRKYKNSDIVVKNIQDIKRLKDKFIAKQLLPQDILSNQSYSIIISNKARFLADIESYLAQIEEGKSKIGLLGKFKSRYKEVNYLEKITLNGLFCDSYETISQLKDYVLAIANIDHELKQIISKGFEVDIDENSSINSKLDILNKAIAEINYNYSIISELESNQSVINFANVFKIDSYDIELIYKKATSFKDDFEKLQLLDEFLKTLTNKLKASSAKIQNSAVRSYFQDYLPFEAITSVISFDQLKFRVQEMIALLEKVSKFKKAEEYLLSVLPNTRSILINVPRKYITKENFEYCFVNDYLKNTEEIDIQKSKENLSVITDKIYSLKSEVLFDLAKYNFKMKFSEEGINDFINLLENYRTNLFQGNRSIRNSVQFQVLARKNSIEISKKLSCWVMKFNDVLDSVGSQPEIFDCIIIDEASQLDFNSLLLGYYAKNMIVVGDDKQTSPSSLTGADGNDFESIKRKHLDFLKDDIIQIRSDNSLFTLAKMVAGASNLSLKEHFRCVPEIIEFSKTEFYNALRPLRQVTENRLEPKKAIFVKDGFLEDKVVYSEIEAIKNYLIQLFNNSIYDGKTIGVVSLGFAKHTEKLKDIKEELSSHFGKQKIDSHKFIIEDSPKFQGDERDIMIVSLGVALDRDKQEKSENPQPRAIISDPDELKKINVALSRARDQMILFYSIQSNDLRENDFRLKILKFFCEKVKEIKPFVLPENEGERSPLNIPSPFDSWFEYDITKNLLEKGFFYLIPQYKVKENETWYNPHLNRETSVHFKLDIVVFNNGKAIAIECDGDPFHSLPEDVAYDIERQEFLERVGWKLYRILYSAYKRNPNQEIEKMIDFINRHSKKSENLLFEKITEKSQPTDFNTEKLSETNNSSDLNIVPINENSGEVNLTELTSFENNVLRYLNINEGGTYSLDSIESANAIFSIPIKESQKKGFLLQCYDNGHVNKVHVTSLLSKKIGYLYSNGINPLARIVYIKIIENDTILAIRYKTNGEINFKAHYTDKISNRELLQLQGYKVMYNDFETIEYKILPKNVQKDVGRLIYESFTAAGKSITNKNYDAEWSILRRLISDFDS